jgi:hypothetical protein
LPFGWHAGEAATLVTLEEELGMGLGLLQVAGFGLLVVVFAVVLFVIFLVGSAVRIVNEYERGVIFRLGRVQGPGEGSRPLLPRPHTRQDDQSRSEDSHYGRARPRT